MPRSSTAKWNLVIALGLLFFVVASCNDPNAIENKRRSGVYAGTVDGQKAGDAEGYESGYKSARAYAYDARLHDLYASHNFSRKKSYTAITVIGAFLLGFGFQYLALFILRRKELLFDIDRLVLPNHGTQVELKHLTVRQESAVGTLEASDLASDDS